MAAAAELNCLGLLGLTPQHLSTLKQWASGDCETWKAGDSPKKSNLGMWMQETMVEISPVQIERV